MSERSRIVSKLKESKAFRAAYIKAKLNVLIPSQIRALRLKSVMPRQEDLAREAQMKQPRISAVETPGAVNFNLETLVRLASAFKVGLIVRFVSFSEMLRWENEFSQDVFNVVGLDNDAEFVRGESLELDKAIAVTSTAGTSSFLHMPAGHVVADNKVSETSGVPVVLPAEPQPHLFLLTAGRPSNYDASGTIIPGLRSTYVQ